MTSKLYAYADGILTIGTGDGAKTFTLSAEKFTGFDGLASSMDEAGVLKLATVLGACYKGTEARKIDAEIAKLEAKCKDWEAKATADPKVKAAREAYARAYNKATATQRTEYRLEAYTARKGATKEDPEFVGIAKDPNTAALLKAFGDHVRLVAFAPDKAKPTEFAWQVFAKDPTAWEAISKVKDLEMTYAGAVEAHKPSELNGDKPGAFDPSTGTFFVKGLPKSNGGAGGSVAGRKVAIGYKIGDTQYKDAEATCKALNITPNSAAPNGTPYWSAALQKHIDSGKVVPIYKTAPA